VVEFDPQYLERPIVIESRVEAFKFSNNALASTVEIFRSDYKLNLEIELELEPRSELWKSFATSSDYFSGSDYILSEFSIKST
jgi:hypothetical protein